MQGIARLFIENKLEFMDMGYIWLENGSQLMLDLWCMISKTWKTPNLNEFPVATCVAIVDACHTEPQICPGVKKGTLWSFIWTIHELPETEAGFAALSFL